MLSDIQELFFHIAYDCILAFFLVVVNTYFREIELSGSFRIPREGPVIFVIAPHANQFVDPILVMEKVKEAAGRRIALLIAAKSYKQALIGTLAKLAHAIPVERPQDNLKSVTGKITVVKDDREKSKTSGEYIKVIGEDTNFTTDCKPKGLLGLPRSLGNAPIDNVESDTVLYLKKPFKIDRENPLKKQKEALELIENGTTFKVAQPIDNHILFENVFDHLNEGKVLGIFPEGGSHDQPRLLPLKVGVAIMALGAITNPKNTEPITVIPTGMNYFHPHKFRSRCVVQFGKPILVDKAHWGQRYEDNSKEAVSDLLNAILIGLEDVTVNCHDYETLKVIQCARRLYTSAHRDDIPLSMVVEMNRRLIKGYEKHKDDEDVKLLREEVLEYDSELRKLGIHDHQVETISKSNRMMAFFLFFSRLFQVLLFCGLALPGGFMFSPVFIVSKHISRKKSKEALAGSLVKLKAKDVVATWKILVALVWAPCIYIFWSVIGTILIIKSNYFQQTPTWIIFVVFYLAAVLTTYASLRIGEIGVDYYKSLKPLFYSVLNQNLDFKQINKLKERRKKLSVKVEKFCDNYGPSIFDDYTEFYENYNSVYKEDDFDIEYENRKGRNGHQRIISSSLLDFDKNDLSNIPIFSSILDAEMEKRGLSRGQSEINLNVHDKAKQHNNEEDSNAVQVDKIKYEENASVSLSIVQGNVMRRKRKQ